MTQRTITNRLFKRFNCRISKYEYETTGRAWAKCIKSKLTDFLISPDHQKVMQVAVDQMRITSDSMAENWKDITVLLYHPDFDHVPEGAEIPHISPHEFTTEQAPEPRRAQFRSTKELMQAGIKGLYDAPVNPMTELPSAKEQSHDHAVDAAAYAEYSCQHPTCSHDPGKDDDMTVVTAEIHTPKKKKETATNTIHKRQEERYQNRRMNENDRIGNAQADRALKERLAAAIVQNEKKAAQQDLHPLFNANAVAFRNETLQCAGNGALLRTLPQGA